MSGDDSAQINGGDSMRIGTFHVLALILAVSVDPFAGHADAVSDALDAMIQTEAEIKALQCSNEGKAAELIMVMRQNGGSPTDVMHEATATGGLDVQKAVKEAFAAPRVNTRSALLRSAEEFRNRYELACMTRVD